MCQDSYGMIDITVGKQLEAVAGMYPGDLAVKYTDRPYERTWKEFNDEAERLAKGFLSIGVSKGDHVAIWATNVPEWLLTLFACAKMGAVLVTVNTNYRVFELEYLLRQSDSKALVMTRNFKTTSYVEIINELCPDLALSEPGNYRSEKLPYLKAVVFAGADPCPPGMLSFAGVLESGGTYDDAAFREIYGSVTPSDVTNMQYTSGTTGFPKGVMLTHYNIVNNGRQIGDCMKFSHADKLCIPVPFFHCFGLVLAVMAALTHATAMVPVEYYSPLAVMQAVQDEGCTAVHGVPTMFIGMLEHPDFKNYKFPRLRTGIMAGSPCPVKVMRQVVDEMGAREITIAYGQTECSPVCTQTTTEDSVELRVSTVGRALPGIEVRIADPETGKTLGPNIPGELCVRGYSVMKGYYKMEEATRQAVDPDGWLHTGDLAARDENGYYHITGRIKDMIIRGGENIYPKEIEEFLYRHPAVRDVQVIGVPSKRLGEEVMACVVLREPGGATEDELKDYVRANMARYKVPSYVAFMDEFPMTASGKIQKFKLREWAVDYLGLGDAAGVVTA